MSQKIKIHYGIMGGERLGPQLRKALRTSGFEITRREAEADIILGHSAGCFWLPTAPSSQKLVLIDPPYWPGKSIKQRARNRVKSSFKFRRHGYSYLRWLKRIFWGQYYLIRDFKRTRRIVKHAQVYDLDSIIKNHQVLLIRNQHDDWLTPELDDLKRHHATLTIFEMPGDHDDWYHNPQQYADLIQSVYGRGK